jgi:hypothetical protein
VSDPQINSQWPSERAKAIGRRVFCAETSLLGRVFIIEIGKRRLGGDCSATRRACVDEPHLLAGIQAWLGELPPDKE